jgi:hypothetical protein
MDTLRQASAEDELMPRSAPQPQLYSAEQSRRLAERELGPGAGGDVTVLLGPDGQLAEAALASVPRRKAAPRLQELTTEVRGLVACCLLPAACCLLPAACCLLPAACCLLPAACCLLPAGASSCAKCSSCLVMLELAVMRSGDDVLT